MKDRAQQDTYTRLVATLALVPMIPVLAILATTWDCGNLMGSSNLIPGFDWVRTFNLNTAVLTVLGVWILWFGAVRWTLGRSIASTAVSIIPFLQVIIAMPLWSTPGCTIPEEFLMIAQEEVSAGFFVWAITWVWWGGARLGPQIDRPMRHIMTRIGKNLICCTGMIPVVFGVWLLAGSAMEQFTDLEEPYLFPLSYAVAAVVSIVSWIIIWHRDVKWTGRIRRLALVTLALFVPTIIFSGFSDSMTGTFYETSAVTAPILAWGLWIVLWPRMLPLKHAGNLSTGPRCLECDYPLSGLKSTRCPECGHEPTLDELWGCE